MVLERTQWNNGYACSCCRIDWEEANWIDKSEMKSFEEIVDEAFSHKLEGIVGRQYESEGKILYGFKTKLAIAFDDFFVMKNGLSIQIRGNQPDWFMTKEELFNKFS